ncbi:MAG TPA: ABC transporter ATP-binding protein [Anaerovoracaceae bacterium]|nr:ABC transporter ATP-binding protein [Anaerovoracaceae bacterium]
MLKIKNLESGYGNIQILNGINMEIKNNQIVALVGSNGAGKTTLLKTVTGLIPYMNGETTFDDEIISGLPAHQIVLKGISMVPEGRQLFSSLSVYENMLMGAYLKSARAVRADSLAEMYELFPRLNERLSQKAGSLSGGEQQMLATARALMSRPKLLLMDEPSWGLAPILTTELFEKIRTIRDSGTSVLIVEQNVYQALKIADWAYVMEKGEIVMEGVGVDLLDNPDLKKAYLGM